MDRVLKLPQEFLIGRVDELLLNAALLCAGLIDSACARQSLLQFLIGHCAELRPSVETKASAGNARILVRRIGVKTEPCASDAGILVGCGCGEHPVQIGCRHALRIIEVAEIEIGERRPSIAEIRVVGERIRYALPSAPESLGTCRRLIVRDTLNLTLALQIGHRRISDVLLKWIQIGREIGAPKSAGRDVGRLIAGNALGRIDAES